jgi:uncharacterized Zn finger protein
MNVMKQNVECPACGRKNELELWFAHEAQGNSMRVFHCAACGQKIDEAICAYPSKITLKGTVVQP